MSNVYIYIYLSIYLSLCVSQQKKTDIFQLLPPPGNSDNSARHRSVDPPPGVHQK